MSSINEVLQITSLNLGITDLGPPSSAKLLSGGATLELNSVFVVISKGD